MWILLIVTLLAMSALTAMQTPREWFKQKVPRTLLGIGYAIGMISVVMVLFVVYRMEDGPLREGIIWTETFYVTFTMYALILSAVRYFAFETARHFQHRNLLAPFTPVNFPTETASLPTNRVSLPTCCVNLPTKTVSLPTVCVNLPTETVSLPTACVILPTICVNLPTETVNLPTTCVNLPTCCDFCKQKNNAPPCRKNAAGGEYSV